MKKPLRREDVILACHSLFDAQMGEPRAFMERPVWPNGPDGRTEATLEEAYGAQALVDPFERIVYQTFRYVGSTEDEVLGALWDDIKRIWLMSPWIARLYWRLPQRIVVSESLQRDASTGLLVPVEWQVRTRMAFPDTRGVLGLGTMEGSSDIADHLLASPQAWR